MSVLIIGNSQKEVKRLRKYFEKIDMTDIVKYKTVEKAIDSVSEAMKEKIDLIILDVLFTHDNSDEVYRDIEILHKWSHAPILLFTMYVTRNTIEKAFEAGIFDFILKPYDFSHFKARIHIALKYRHESKLRRHQECNLQKELAIAKSVQKSLLTPSMHLQRVQYDALYLPSHTLGGDMYNWFKINDHLTAVILYDVMGHGVASSLITMSIRSWLRGMLMKLDDPYFVIEGLNHHLCELFDDEQTDSFLVTAIYMVIDTKNGIIQYVNAAHPAGIVFDRYGNTNMLSSNTPILGLFPTIQITKQILPIAHWQRIILYTDGLLTVSDNQKMDIQVFQQWLNEDNAQALQKYVTQYGLVENYYKDDITVVSITVTS